MAEVRVAKSAGFCYGVERAVKLAEETAREKGGCAMLGSIIHNVHVVAELEALGARQVYIWTRIWCVRPVSSRHSTSVT